MARVTVEDCVKKIPNRFELIMLAAQRARKIGAGAPLTIERDNDKNPVVSLREIAEETVAVEDLKEDLIRSKQRIATFDEDDDDIDLMDGEEEWGKMASGSVQSGEAGASLYGDENIDEGEQGDPSLEDLAGAPIGEDDE